MELMDINLVPLWLLGISLIFSGTIWILAKKANIIRVDPFTWAYTYICVGILFLIAYLSEDRASLEWRVLRDRLFILLLSLSQWLPLLISYIRHLKEREKK